MLMYMYARMYVCMYVCIYVFLMCVYAYICMCMYCGYVCIYVWYVSRGFLTISILQPSFCTFIVRFWHLCVSHFIVDNTSLSLYQF